MTEFSRGEFLKMLIAGIPGILFPIVLNASPFLKGIKHPVTIFSKHLQWLNYNDMAALAKKMGFDGVDLTVRPGGHVLPENAEKDLPRAVNAIRDKGLEVYSITTNITDPDDIRHATVEQPESWPVSLELLAPYIKTIDIKDFKWKLKGEKNRAINTPLGEGVVDFDKFFSLLKKFNIEAVSSLHIEYDAGGSEHGSEKLSISKEEFVQLVKKDHNFLDNHLQTFLQNP